MTNSPLSHLTIVEVVSEILDPLSTVTDYSRTSKDFQFDVVVPGGYDRATLREAEVGAMRGGLRVAMRNQTNIAPYMQPYTYRLECRNGMETRHDDLKFSARGLDLDELLVEFESMARRAFSRVDASMHALDDLHNQPVHDLTQALVRVGQEYELPERIILDMTARAPAFLNGQDPTLFTVVDMVTNEANNPAIRNRSGGPASIGAGWGPRGNRSRQPLRQV